MTVPNKSVVCFGEVLWDILPTGKVPGGAPMNVCYHLHQHHIRTSLITRIGNDEPGIAISSLFAERGIDTSFFTVDFEHETGKVYGTADANYNMTYDIVQPVAWDFIPLEDRNIKLVREADYFVFGSLSARSETSRQTLLSLLEHAAIKVMDVNLRPPHFKRDILENLIAKADILKLNEDELQLIGSWYSRSTDRKELIRQINKKFNIPTIVVTLGAAGALIYINDEFFEHPGYKVKVADTVGSGDAFLAGLITKFIAGAAPAEALDYAARLGAFVATKEGGCPVYQPSDAQNI